MKKYFPLLDAVRFFAAFWVMNFHYFLGLSGGVHWYRYGNLGVQLFFIISGFVIVQSLQGKTLKQFATGRFIRLYPLFWILCTLTYIITLSVPHADHLQFAEYLSSMTMLGDKFNGYAGFGNLVDPSYWTLSVELIFYIGIGLFAYFFSYKNIRYFLGIFLTFSMVIFLSHIYQNFYIRLALVQHASYFVFGGALALIATKQAKNLFQKYFDWVLMITGACFATYIYPTAFPLYDTPHSLDATIILILHIIFFIGIYLMVSLSSQVKNTQVIRLLVILGGLTYPLYLLHQTIGNTVIHYATTTYQIPRVAFTIFFMLFIIAISYVVFVLDKKMRVWLQKKLLPSKAREHTLS